MELWLECKININLKKEKLESIFSLPCGGRGDSLGERRILILILESLLECPQGEKADTVLTKYHRPGTFNNRNMCPRCYER